MYSSLRRNRLFAAWVALLLLVIGLGLAATLRQWEQGLMLTGLSRQMSWGLYIGAFTFLVGIAASALAPSVLALYGAVPRSLALYGEALAAATVLTAMLCVMVDLGRPQLVLNILLHPSPTSPMFWDFLALSLYCLLNLILLRTALEARSQGLPEPFWTRPLALAAIPLAVAIHTITAFIYAGLPDRPYWLSAILAARFLASALCSGPAVLLLGLFLIQRLTHIPRFTFPPRPLLHWIGWSLALHCFFFGLELFTVYFSGLPGSEAFALRFTESGSLWFISAWVLAAIALILLLPALRKALPLTLTLIVFAVWQDKASGMMRGGFSPDSFGIAVVYAPSITEVFILLGIFSVGLLFLTFLWRAIAQNHNFSI